LTWEKKINNAGPKWAGIDEGKAEMKKVHHAEKELDKAKDAWKRFEKYEEKKAASNPKIIAFFPIDLLEHDQLKGSRQSE